MPLTDIWQPILAQFLCAVSNTTGKPVMPSDASPTQAQATEQKKDDAKPKQLPKGVVLGPDGKPYAHISLSHNNPQH